MGTQHTEFFPGLSGKPGMTRCRGWQSPQGIGLILPYSLVSVEAEQNRYSTISQLWRDANGGFWIISYCDVQCEWYACHMGRDLENAKTNLAADRAHEIRLRTPAALRVLAASEGATLEEIWHEVRRESDYIEDERFFCGSRGDEDFYCDIQFRDGSCLRVLHPFGIKNSETKLIEAFSSSIC